MLPRMGLDLDRSSLGLAQGLDPAIPEALDHGIGVIAFLGLLREVRDQARLSFLDPFFKARAVGFSGIVFPNPNDLNRPITQILKRLEYPTGRYAVGVDELELTERSL